MEFYGPIPPMITPFDQAGKVDLDGHQKNVEHWIEAGVGGLLVLGSNSETAYLEESEKLALIEGTANQAKNLPVMVGTGLESAYATIKLTNKAADLGAHSALILTPNYYQGKMGAAAQINYFTEVADQSDIPILIYNVTKFTGINLSPETLRVLSQHPNITGMKDSSGSIGQLVLIQSVVSDQFQVLTGTASIWLPALQLGVKSAVMALANCAPEACIQIQKQFEAGELTTATELYRKMVVVNQAVTATFGIAGLKYACSKLGLTGGYVRNPLSDLGSTEMQQMDQILKAGGLIS